MLHCPSPGSERLQVLFENHEIAAHDSITGELGASVEGAPAKIEGKQTSGGDPSSTRYTAAVSVGIPLVGGKIEKAIAEQLNRLLDAERDETLNWEAGNR